MTNPLQIGVTQRVVDIPELNERRDVLDQSWTKFLWACGFELIPIPNSHPNPRDFLKRLGIKGIILTGGNNLSRSILSLEGADSVGLPEMDDLAPERDKTETALLKYSIEFQIPVLGVCRGMQVINIFHGGQIQKIEGHVNIDHDLDYVNKLAPYSHFFRRSRVNSFHEIGITQRDVAPNFTILAQAGQSVEAAIHNKYKHLGIMWHPERGEHFSEGNKELVKSFFWDC